MKPDFINVFPENNFEFAFCRKKGTTKSIFLISNRINYHSPFFKVSHHPLVIVLIYIT